MLLFHTGARLNGIWGPETLPVQAEQVCCRGFQSHKHTGEHTLAQTRIYTAVYTLQSHNATRFNAAAAQIGHLKPGRRILTLLSNFQWVKLKFYEYDRIRKHHWKKNVKGLSVLLLSSIILGLKTITYIGWSFSSAGHIPIKFAVDTHCPHAVYSFYFKCPVTFVLASTKDQNMLWCTINIDLEQVLNFLVRRGCTLIYYGDTVLFKHLL